MPAMHYNVLEVVYGDSVGAYITSIGYDNYEAIGKGHPFPDRAGDEGARKLEAKVGGIRSHVERFVSRYGPELSWMPQPGSN